jgi:hypothetical protein
LKEYVKNIALETASVTPKGAHQPTVVSNADKIKVEIPTRSTRT